jgi:Ni,Fe-hydrogenase III small subunit
MDEAPRRKKFKRRGLYLLMQKLADYLKNSLLNWAMKRLVRVAVFGPTLASVEWISLGTTPYARYRPRVQLTSFTPEAELLALHGPVTALNWPLVQKWLSDRNPRAKILVVGPDVFLDSKGFILNPEGVASHFRADFLLPGCPPAPQELMAAVQSIFEVKHV